MEGKHLRTADEGVITVPYAAGKLIRILYGRIKEEIGRMNGDDSVPILELDGAILKRYIGDSQNIYEFIGILKVLHALYINAVDIGVIPKYGSEFDRGSAYYRGLYGEFDIGRIKYIISQIHGDSPFVKTAEFLEMLIGAIEEYIPEVKMKRPPRKRTDNFGGRKIYRIDGSITDFFGTAAALFGLLCRPARTYLSNLPKTVRDDPYASVFFLPESLACRLADYSVFFGNKPISLAVLRKRFPEIYSLALTVPPLMNFYSNGKEIFIVISELGRDFIVKLNTMRTLGRMPPVYMRGRTALVHIFGEKSVPSFQ